MSQKDLSPSVKRQKQILKEMQNKEELPKSPPENPCPVHPLLEEPCWLCKNLGYRQ